MLKVMKVGSIVECVEVPRQFLNIKSMGATIPVLKCAYTVREVGEDQGDVFLRFEEIVNPVQSWPRGPIAEAAFGAIYFREIEFPSALEAEIKECLERELAE
jgi:hypothetical protein